MGGRRRQPGRQAPLLRAAGPRGLAERRARRAAGRGRSRAPTRSCSTSTSGSPRSTRTGHIPGARYLDTNWLESPADWNRRTPAELDHALRSLGITADTTVVVYGRDTEGDANEKWPGRRAGQIAATRAALILRYAGVDDVRLLDGGYDWWVRDGHPVETTPRQPVSVPEFGSSIPRAPGAHRRPAGGEGDPRRPRRRGARQRPDLEGAHRQGQRLQLHRAGRPDPGRRVGQLRHRRVPHAALPERGQHDAGVPGDRRQLGRGRDHRRQVGRVLLRHRAGAPARRGSTPTSRAGSGSPCTTAAGSSGARTRSTTRSTSAIPPRDHR